MKPLLALILIIFLGLDIAMGQSLNDDGFPLNKDGKIEYTEVIAVDSVSQDALFSRAKLFVANVFNSSSHVTKLEDEHSFTIVTKGAFPRVYFNPFNKAQGGAVWFKFFIQCKNGRYRYSVTDLEHKAVIGEPDTGGDLGNEKPTCIGILISKKNWRKIKEKTHTDVFDFLAELKKSMIGTNDNNW